MTATVPPREGMMAVVRNRRALITGVQPFGAEDKARLHLVEIEYTDGVGAETEQMLWEAEPGRNVLEPASLPQVETAPPMESREFDAMIRAARWSALTPSLPFSGLVEDRPPVVAQLFGAIHAEAYQLVPVLRALEMPRVALMLADAVGLGKTIQAGMILRELMLRRRIRRVLILCPAALRTQWRDELNEKFSLPFDVVDRPHSLRLQRELGIDANPWRVHERVVASYHYLKQPDVLEQFRNTAEPGADGRLRWDLLIVDEAHNLAPSSFGDDSDLAEMLQQIAPWFDHRVFLTATPHNGHTRSFSGLLEALDPVRFTRKSELDDEDRARISESVVRRLKSQINRSYVAVGEAPRFSERHVEALPVLRFGAQERQLSEAFHTFRSALEKATARSSPSDPSDRNAARFAIEVLQKRLLSGPWAFGQSWLNLLEGLAERSTTEAQPAAVRVAQVRATQIEETDDDAERESRERQANRTAGAWLKVWRDKLAEEIAAVSKAVEALGVTRVQLDLEPQERQRSLATGATKVRMDARLRALETLIKEKLRAGDAWKAGDQTGERLVVFTEYLASLEYIAARVRALYGDGNWLLSLFGGMDDNARDNVKHEFTDPNSSARILLATDAAGEGLNLQTSCRLLLHWDIPWNPGKMEQRNGRLDRHGQERDVYIFHFDSTDDASMSFLGKVLKKRNQTREDRVVTDEIFSQALLAHFAYAEDADAAEEWLERTIKRSNAESVGKPDDVPQAAALPAIQERARLEELRAELDLTPDTLRDTLETSLAIDAGRPRLHANHIKGRYRFSPVPGNGLVPAGWQEIVEETLSDSARKSGFALVFDPEHYLVTRSGRPVFLPEPDSKLLHLGHALYHRVMSTFARYRFPGGPKAATRWCVRVTPELPANADALIMLTIEELAVNQLREPCHHWVRTLVLPVQKGALGEPLAHRPPIAWHVAAGTGDSHKARAIWDEVQGEVKDVVKALQRTRTNEIRVRLTHAGERVAAQEKKRFAKRRKELEKALSDNQIARLEKEIAAYLARRQQNLFQEHDDEERRKLTDKQAELELRRRHYDLVLHRLADEERRTLERVLPPRYELRDEARVYPIAIEIRVPAVSNGKIHKKERSS
jgi:hypothetical protein